MSYLAFLEDYSSVYLREVKTNTDFCWNGNSVGKEVVRESRGQPGSLEWAVAVAMDLMSPALETGFPGLHLPAGQCYQSVNKVSRKESI